LLWQPSGSPKKMPHKKCCCCCLPPVKGLLVMYSVFLGLSFLGIYQYMPAPSASFFATFTDYGVENHKELCSNSSATDYCALLCEKDGAPFEYETFASAQKTIGFARFATYVILNLGGNAIGLVGVLAKSHKVITVAIVASILQPLNTVAFVGIGFPSASDGLRALQISILNDHVTGVSDCKSDCPACTGTWVDSLEQFQIFGSIFGVVAILFTCLISGFTIYNSWIVVRILKNPALAAPTMTAQQVMPVANAHAVPIAHAKPVAHAVAVPA